MEVLIPLFLTFLIPLITAPLIAKRRVDLSIAKISVRFGSAAGAFVLILMLLFTGAAAGLVGGGLGAFFLAVLSLPAALLAFGLGAGAAAIGAHLGRRK